jgi:Ca2+-binding EF-hand superfamily protein
MAVIKFGVVTLCLMLVAGVASAASPEVAAVQQQRFATWDTDGDGFLSPAEAQKVDGLSAAFQKADANQDGKVDAQEYAKFESVDED